MEAAQSQSYFLPPFDACVQRRQHVVSWRDIYTCLVDPSCHAFKPTISKIFRDQKIRDLVVSPYHAYGKPTGETRKAFENVTSAVNAPSSITELCDPQELKDDALWLSQEGTVDELSALRIALLQWRDSSSAKLLTQWTEEEVIGLRNTTATTSGSILAQLVSRASVADAESKTSEQKEATAERRAALFLRLLEEREYIWKTSVAIMGAAQRAELRWPAQGREPSQAASQLRSIAEPLWSAHVTAIEEQAPSEHVSFLVKEIQGLLSIGLETEGRPKVVGSVPGLDVAFQASIAERIVSVLRLLQLHLCRDRSSPSSVTQVNAWYDLLNMNGFLTSVSEIISGHSEQLLETIQGLVGVLSVEVLRMTVTIDVITNQVQSTKSLYPQIATSYIEDEGCLRLVTACLLAAVEAGIPSAGPPALAWALIARRLRWAADVCGSGEEHTVEQNSELRTSPVPTRRSSMRDSGAKVGKLDRLLQAVLEVYTYDDAINLLGNRALQDLGALDYAASANEHLSSTFRLAGDTHTVICSRLSIYELARFAAESCYGSSLAQAVTSILTYNNIDTLAATSLPRLLWPSQPAKLLSEDKEIMGPLFMAQVVSRYPYEMGAFATCLHAAARSIAYVDEESSKIARLLDSLTTFACQVNQPGLVDLDARIEEKATLNEDMPIFRLKSGQPNIDHGTLPYIPAGTPGIVLCDGATTVIRWEFPHSGLEYLGLLLSSVGRHARLEALLLPSDFDEFVFAEVISLITTMLLGSLVYADPQAGTQLLGSLSDGLARNNDIISVIFSIFEDQLVQAANQKGDFGTLAILSKCVEFISVAIQITPSRIWAQLSRCGLLPREDSSGAIPAIVAAAEIPSADFSFLASCIDLYDCLVNDCVMRAVRCNSGNGTKAVTRFEERAVSSGNTPAKMTSTILFNFTRVAVDILQSQTSWRFEEAQQRYKIVTGLLRTFNRILLCISTGGATGSKLFAILEASSAEITTTFLVESAADLPFQALIDIFVTALADIPANLDTRHNHELVQLTTVTLQTCISLLKIGSLQQKSGEKLRSYLFKSLPLLARLYALHQAFVPLVADLLTSLVQYANEGTKEPPSLLAHLPPKPTKAFLDIIVGLPQPLHGLDCEISVWDLLSAIVCSRQQWLAINLLTGHSPRDRLQAAKSESTRMSRSVMVKALTGLTRIESLPPRRIISLLHFISRAQTHWAWVSRDIAEHKSFVTTLLDWLSRLTINTRSSDTEVCIRNADEMHIAALAVDILARYLHNTEPTKRQDLAKQMFPKLGYLRDHATAVDGYNHSLHKNLVKNFEQKFPGVSLSSFKRSSLKPAELGRDYYYDLELAGDVLDFDPSWRRSKGQGFVDELARANVNFSLVDSQIALLKSWKSLALEICAALPSDADFQRDMVTVITNCLKHLSQSTIPTQLFENISSIRAGFAFAALQQLNTAGARAPETQSLFATAWDAVRVAGVDFEVITDDQVASQYRTMLQILFLSLQFHVDQSGASAKPKSKETLTKSASTLSIPLTPLAASLLEVFNKVIAVNFRALCTLVHAETPDNPTIAEPSDFVLLTALLQTILRIPAILPIHKQITSLVADGSLVRYATSLFSWSSSLNPTDPIYGELSILFLLSLSTLPSTAELIATSDVLPAILSAPLSAHFRAGRGPFDQPFRINTIWARGILPLLLNLLTAVGAPIAGEISSFVNSFSAQMQRCETEIMAPLQPSVREPHRGCITLGLAIEVHNIALIAAVIEGLRLQGAAVGVDATELESIAFDRKTVGEVAQGLVRDRRGLRERIVAVGEREEGLKGKQGKDGADRLEELVASELQGAIDAAAAV